MSKITSLIDNPVNLGGQLVVPAKGTVEIDLMTYHPAYRESLFAAIVASVQGKVITVDEDFALPPAPISTVGRIVREHLGVVVLASAPEVDAEIAAAEAAAKLEADRLATEALEAEKAEADKLAAEAAQLEADKLAAEAAKLEADKAEADKLAAEAAKLEAETPVVVLDTPAQVAELPIL